MDTREKILSREAAERMLRSRPDALVVTGYFDPLLAQHARRLQQIGSRLIVAVRSSEDGLMPKRAREEMVASLACVEFVIPEDCLALLSRGRLIREEQADLERRSAFAAHVRRRAG